MTTATGGSIPVDVQGSVAILRLHSPERRNAISTGMWQAISTFAREVSSRTDVRAVVFRGDGEDDFSSGADISDFADHRTGLDGTQSYDTLVEESCRAVEAITQPTIASIRGACIGAGASLAASCDLRIAAVDGYFAVPAAKLGLGYDVRGIGRFARVFGSPIAAALLFTASRIDVAQAHAAGAVQYLCDGPELESKTQALALRIAANAPLTLRAAKLALRALRDPGLADDALHATVAADGSADYQEGRAAFFEKRPPRFEGS